MVQPLLLIFVPLLAAATAFLLWRRGGWAIGLAAASVTTLAAGWLAVEVGRSGPQRYRLGGWGAPLGIDLVADGLAAVMLLMTAVVGLAVSVYAAAYFQPRRGAEHRSAATNFWPLWLLLSGALNALFLSGDVFNLYVTLELMSLSSVGLVALGGTPQALVAAMRYILAGLLGSLAYLLGVALLYGTYRTLDLALLGQMVAPGYTTAVAMGLMTVGLLLKTALFPLHYWLPPAHASAPAPVSAALSALVVKGTYYILLRLWLGVFEPLVLPQTALLLGGLGAAAVVWGSLQALAATRVKDLVAYSTVAQLGYLFLVFPLTWPPAAGALGYRGGVMYALSHALAKAAMFLAAGNMLYAVGSDEIHRLRGLGLALPRTMFAFAVAGVCLMGLPPSGNFTAKWMFIQAAIAAGQWWLVVLTLAGGLLAAAYTFRVLHYAFARPAEPKVHLVRPPWLMQWSAMALAIAALLLGLATGLVTPLLELPHQQSAAAGSLAP